MNVIQKHDDDLVDMVVKQSMVAGNVRCQCILTV